MSAQRTKRLQVELKGLLSSPPPGITCRIDDSNVEVIIARIDGPENSPFFGACFEVEISPSERYPYTPPSAKFVTPVYHPNIDSQGRICLSGLKSKPAGSWNCTMNMAIILSAIRVLLAEPNLSDPLMTDVAAEFQDNYQHYFEKARESAKKHSVVQVPEPERMEEDTTTSALSERNVDFPAKPILTKQESLITSPARTSGTPLLESSTCKTTPGTPEVVTVDSTDDTDSDSLSPILNTSQRVMAPLPVANVYKVKRGLFCQSSETSVKPVSNERAKTQPTTVVVSEPAKPRAALSVDDFMFDSDEDDFFVPPKKQAKLS